MREAIKGQNTTVDPDTRPRHYDSAKMGKSDKSQRKLTFETGSIVKTPKANERQGSPGGSMHSEDDPAQSTDIREILLELKAGIGNIDSKLISLSTKVDQLQHRLDKHGDRLDNAEQRISDVEDNISSLSTKIIKTLKSTDESIKVPTDRVVSLHEKLLVVKKEFEVSVPPVVKSSTLETEIQEQVGSVTDFETKAQLSEHEIQEQMKSLTDLEPKAQLSEHEIQEQMKSLTDLEPKAQLSEHEIQEQMKSLTDLEPKAQLTEDEIQEEVESATTVEPKTRLSEHEFQEQKASVTDFEQKTLLSEHEHEFEEQVGSTTDFEPTTPVNEKVLLIECCTEVEALLSNTLDVRPLNAVPFEVSLLSINSLLELFNTAHGGIIIGGSLFEWIITIFTKDFVSP
ncbi:tropomyosin alpha-1 chain-like [Ambystoma mexicanum]|uniref:tropomyosin alpha-1 chain-like n=1 Tax=Ambystoma mexicanum TaxID=8296 RepID=UPI0037E93243